MIIDEPFDGVFNGEDVDAEHRKYMSLLMDYTGGNPIQAETKVRHRLEIPKEYNINLQSEEFQSLSYETRKEIESFWAEQDKRSAIGHDGVCGLQYGYFHFGRHHGGKSKYTTYRRADNALFSLLTQALYGLSDDFQGVVFRDRNGVIIDPHNKGVLELGRRRTGKSAKMGWFALDTIRRNENVVIIITSKTEDDAKYKVVENKVKFMYNHLPDAMRPKSKGRASGVLWLAEDEIDSGGSKITSGLNSRIMAETPKAEAVEGETLLAWLHDEGPKTKDLRQLTDMTLPALNDEEGFVREGLAWVTGVAGDFDKHGTDFIEMWEDATSMDFIRWFSAGWYSMNVNELGNEDIEKNVRMILEARNKIMSNKRTSTAAKEKSMRTHQQQFPLTPKEALLASSSGLFDAMALKDQEDMVKNAIESGQVHIREGEMRWEVPNRKSVFIPGFGGPVKVLEPPKVGAKYVAGSDSYGLSQKGYGSSPAAWIFKLKNPQISPLEQRHLMDELMVARDPKNINYKKILETHLEMGHLPVAYYMDAPRDPSVFVKELFKLLLWYEVESNMNRPVKVLAETEPSNVIENMLKMSPRHLMREPQKASDVFKNRKEPPFGISIKKGHWLDSRLNETAHYIDNFIDRMYFEEFLKKAATYDMDSNKHDIVDGFGVTLIAANSPEMKAYLRSFAHQERPKGQVMNFRRQRGRF